MSNLILILALVITLFFTGCSQTQYSDNPCKIKQSAERDPNDISDKDTEVKKMSLTEFLGYSFELLLSPLKENKPVGGMQYKEDSPFKTVREIDD